MFNPSDLKLVTSSKRDIPHFVGIRVVRGNKPEFRLPVGFDDFPEEPAAVNNQFFSLYKTLKAFADQIGRLATTKYDGVRDKGRTGGLSYVNEQGEDVTLFSKLEMIDSILDGYDELRIFRIVHRSRRTENVDYGQIHKYLEEAVYLKNDVAFIDEMTLPQPVLSYDVTDLVRMFCYIYSEVKSALGEGKTLNHQVQGLAEIFKEQHLNTDSALFSENAHARTVRVLRSKLDEIDKQVSFKSGDYWHFFDATQTFLYGGIAAKEEGIVWGVSSFSDVWESMCFVYTFSAVSDNIVYADSARHANDRIGGYSLYRDESFNSPFFIEHQETRRFMRPDQINRFDRSPEKWFENTFTVTWPSSRKCVIELNREEPFHQSSFEMLTDKLTPAGFRRPRGRKRTFRPVSKRRFDEVREKVISKAKQSKNPFTKKFVVWDYKYMPRTAYTVSSLKGKPKHDLRKQVVYEYALQLNYPSYETNSYLCIPRYFKEDIGKIGSEVPLDILNHEFKNQGVEVYEADYKKIEQAYISTLYDKHE